jgi:hypothetical protein
MNLRILLSLFITIICGNAWAQTTAQPQPEPAALAKTIQSYLKANPTPWAKNYEALQKQEMAWFSLNNFKKIWDLEPNLTVTSTGNKFSPWAVRFNPEYPGEKHHPVWQTYDISACLSKAAGTVTLLDFDLVFLMDSTWKVKKVQPGIQMLEDGKSRHLGPNAIFDHVWDDCMTLAVSDMERSQPALVGSRWKKVAAFLASCETRKGEINDAIAAAVKKKYTTAEVTEVMACEGPVQECFDVTDPLAGELQTDGIFRAASGPGMLYYHAKIMVKDEVGVVVDRVWK